MIDGSMAARDSIGAEVDGWRSAAAASAKCDFSGKSHSVCLTADASGGLKSHSARGPGLISKGGGNASPAEDDGKVWRG